MKKNLSPPKVKSLLYLLCSLLLLLASCQESENIVEPESPSEEIAVDSVNAYQIGKYYDIDRITLRHFEQNDTTIVIEFNSPTARLKGSFKFIDERYFEVSTLASVPGAKEFIKRYQYTLDGAFLNIVNSEYQHIFEELLPQIPDVLGEDVYNTEQRYGLMKNGLIKGNSQYILTVYFQ